MMGLALSALLIINIKWDNAKNCLYEVFCDILDIPQVEQPTPMIPLNHTPAASTSNMKQSRDDSNRRPVVTIRDPSRVGAIRRAATVAQLESTEHSTVVDPRLANTQIFY